MSTVQQYSLAAHPRARRQITRAKALAGLVALVAVTLLGHRAGTPLPDALQRGIEAAVGAYLVTWMAAVLVWRQLAQAELELARRRLLERAEKLVAERSSSPE